VATNGLKLASSPDLCRALVQSGLSTVYLQFDAVTPEPFKAMRGLDLLSVKEKAIENLRLQDRAVLCLFRRWQKG